MAEQESGMKRIAVVTGATAGASQDQADGETQAGEADVDASVGPANLVVQDSVIMPLAATTSGEIDRFHRIVSAAPDEGTRAPATEGESDEVDAGRKAAWSTRAERLARVLAESLRGRKVTITVVRSRAGPRRSGS